ncbi:MAG: dephospho-CoA kinase [Verrucomicrobia bacterium]|nr:MAG: dephospho-CoA kinase [Verrucomicrobiota bacterium]PYL75808.1 MAG: dephospho-CoA kinase [Verrucomicrobiota bacterium]
MPAIGITGGISTGKSTFVECLREVLPEATFFDADAAVHKLFDRPEVQKDIQREFGTRVFSTVGDLNRAKLRAIVFSDATKKCALERILHPRIRRQWRTVAKEHRNSPNFFFADIPLLYETGGETLCDRVVVVACSQKVQLGRLKKRMSITAAEGRKMIKSQMPLEEKIRRADHVIWNNGDRTSLMDQARFLAASWQGQTWTKT